KEVVGQRVGVLACPAPADDRLGQAPKILDEHHPQRDRHRPQLPDGQGLDALVGEDEPPERFRVEPTIRVRDERPGQPVDARIPGERPVSELGELAVEAVRQVIADLAYLYVYEMDVVV